ncbi:VP1 [His2 virus]|uniref:VP1 n=1 Tax=His 2 virus TaxID=128710 RepID=Q25BD1_HIS2V|nr:VP1 [His2 virus]AAQ13805.1 VP1 [His2 virus]
MKSKIGSIIGVMLIVGTAIGAPIMTNAGISPVGTASATHDCDTTDALVAAATFTYVNYDKCTQNHVDYVIEDMQNKDAQQVKTDIYQNSLETNAQSRVFGQTIDNYANDTRTIAQSIGKNAYIRELENGSSETVARSQAKLKASDYYSKKQVQLLKQWEAQALAYDYAARTANNETGVTGPDDDRLDTFVGFAQSHPYEDGGTINYHGLSTQTATLANGTTYTYQSVRVEVEAGYDEGDDFTRTISAHTSQNLESSAGSGRSSIILESGKIRAPNSNYDSIRVLEWDKSINRFNEIKSQNTQVQDNIDLFVDNTYTEYQQGTIDSTDLVDPSTLGRDFATSYDETGYYTYAIGSLALMGQNVPDMNKTGSFIVQYSGTEYEGMLTSQGTPPNGTFEAGNTYNTSNIEGVQILITSEGQQLELSGEFTVKEITSKDGESLDSVGMESYSYDSANINEYKNLQEQLRNLREDVEKTEPKTGGSSSSNSGASIPEWLEDKYFGIPLWGIIVTALAGLYVVQSGRGN